MKTAVEWLYNELSKNNTSTDSVIQKINKELSIWQQAKEKEKEQIVNAFDLGRDDVTSMFLIDGEDYYNKSYNQNK